jgi:peptidoglycan/LPS O-acetylase OafA/YrhL
LNKPLKALSNLNSHTHQSNKIHFPGLNGLRFVAALAVIITHIELIKKLMNGLYPFQQGWLDLWGNWQSGEKMGQAVVETLPVLAIIKDSDVHWYSPIVHQAGPMGVVFFFVLSGFLITYLLLAEKAQFGDISIRKFYVRRLLRIWPLYLLVIILGFFILPLISWFYVPYQSAILSPQQSHEFWVAFVLFLFMAPNMAYALFGPFPNIGQSWSIGVEEQFYLIWPWIIRKAKLPLVAIVRFFLAFLTLKVVVIMASRLWDWEVLDVFRTFLAMSKLESMAIGAMGAWVLFTRRERLLKFIYQRYVQALSLVGLVIVLYFTPSLLENLIHLLFSPLFLIIILNVASNPKSIIKMRWRVFDFLGQISYGIYMYHMLVIAFVLHLYMHFAPVREIQPWYDHALIYASVIGITIFVSYLSHRFFESRFIRLKSRFAQIKSSDTASS